jgi:anti-sigma factor RsiW
MPTDIQQPKPCDSYADLLVDLSDGDLAPSDRQTIENHLASCPACRAHLARLDASLARLKSSIATTPSVMLSLQRAPARRLFAHRSFAWATATVATIVLCLAAAWRLPSHSSIDLPVASPAPPTKITQRDALWHIALVEQQARLQTSLDLMPTDEWYGQQRAENEHIVERIRQAAARRGESL